MVAGPVIKAGPGRASFSVPNIGNPWAGLTQAILQGKQEASQQRMAQQKMEQEQAATEAERLRQQQIADAQINAMLKLESGTSKSDVLQGLIGKPGSGDILDSVMGWEPPKAPERKMLKGADGYTYYQDTGERVLPNVMKPAPAPDVPTSVDEYKFAQSQGYKGSYEDFKTLNKSSTNINVNTNEKGFERVGDYMLTVDGQGNPQMTVIKGSDTWNQLQEGKEKDEQLAELEGETRDIVTEDIDRALAIVDTEGFNLPVTGMVGSYLSGVPGTKAHDVRKLLDTVQANIGFDKLQAMRNASKTGGALGQVSERELALLQAVKGNLEQSQSTEQFRFNLMRLRDTYNQIVHGTPPTATTQTTPLPAAEPIQSQALPGPQGSGGIIPAANAGAIPPAPPQPESATPESVMAKYDQAAAQPGYDPIAFFDTLNAAERKALREALAKQAAQADVMNDIFLSP